MTSNMHPRLAQQVSNFQRQIKAMAVLLSDPNAKRWVELIADAQTEDIVELITMDGARMSNDIPQLRSVILKIITEIRNEHRRETRGDHKKLRQGQLDL